MPLVPYKRNGKWWFKGRIDELPASKYYRQSTGSSASLPEQKAIQVIAEFQARQIKRYYAGAEKSLTFSEAVLLFDPDEETAKALIKLVPHIGDRLIADLSPLEIRKLGPKIAPMSSTDTWQRWVITPIRSVINNAHDLGQGPPIRIKSYSKAERLKQDKLRNKKSRVEKTPGSWPWIHAFREHSASPYRKAMALFMFETGARISQACALKPEDLDLQNARVRMPEAKGTEEQWVYISTELVVELANLRPRRPRPSPKNKRRMTLKVFGYASKDGVYKGWKADCKRAGIELIMPHAAGRHGFGTEMLVRQGLDATTVAKAGRWSDKNLMQKTYAHAENTNQRVQDALRTGRVQSESQGKPKQLK